MTAYIDMRVVDESQREVCIDAVAEVDVFARPIGIERRLDIAVLADVAEHLLHQPLSLLLLRRAGRVEVVQLFEQPLLLVHEVAQRRVVELSRVQKMFAVHILKKKGPRRGPPVVCHLKWI